MINQVHRFIDKGGLMVCAKWLQMPNHDEMRSALLKTLRTSLPITRADIAQNGLLCQRVKDLCYSEILLLGNSARALAELWNVDIRGGPPAPIASPRKRQAPTPSPMKSRKKQKVDNTPPTPALSGFSEEEAAALSAKLASRTGQTRQISLLVPSTDISTLPGPKIQRNPPNSAPVTRKKRQTTKPASRKTTLDPPPTKTPKAKPKRQSKSPAPKRKKRVVKKKGVEAVLRDILSSEDESSSPSEEEYTPPSYLDNIEVPDFYSDDLSPLFSPPKTRARSKKTEKHPPPSSPKPRPSHPRTVAKRSKPKPKPSTPSRKAYFSNSDTEEEEKELEDDEFIPLPIESPEMALSPEPWDPPMETTYSPEPLEPSRPSSPPPSPPPSLEIETPASSHRIPSPPPVYPSAIFPSFVPTPQRSSSSISNPHLLSRQITKWRASKIQSRIPWRTPVALTLPVGPMTNYSEIHFHSEAAILENDRQRHVPASTVLCDSPIEESHCVEGGYYDEDDVAIIPLEDQCNPYE